MVSDDENDQDASQAAFDVLHYLVGKRLALGRLTVVDATNLEERSRRPLLELADEHNVAAVAFVLDVPPDVCEQRASQRGDRELPPEVVQQQVRQLEAATGRLSHEGFRQVVTLSGTDEISKVTVERRRPPTDRRDDDGPFDIIGDVHGCADELVSLLGEMGYEVAPDRLAASHPEGRRAVFLGDLVDRGPDTPGVLRLVMGMVRAGTALCLPGNHENKLARALKGHDVTIGHGLAESLEQLAGCSEAFRSEVVGFVDGLESHVVLDDGDLVVAHAGLPERMHNRVSGRVYRFALYGDTTGETDELGLPVRYPWAKDYEGSATVVYGHTPVDKPEWLNNTICIDTGCVFGGALTALRYPERELVSVPAAKVYYGPRRSFPPDAVSAGWLIYLPPRLPPGPPSQRPGLLEHPDEVFSLYRQEGVKEIVCEYMHGGDRAVAVVCRDADAAQRRFSLEGAEAPPALGAVYDRTGRPFFAAPALEAQALQVLRDAVGVTSLWEELGTDWLALDMGIVSPQGPNGDADRPLLAPFTVLAGESRVHAARDRVWHLDLMDRLAGAVSDALLPTRYKLVDLSDVISQAEGIAWWQDLTAAGGDGMVVRPRGDGGETPVPSEDPGAAPAHSVPPGFVCRGQRFLRRVYGEDYGEPENLSRLRSRDLEREWALALEERTLALDGLELFVKGAQLDDVHECVLGVFVLSAVRRA